MKDLQRRSLALDATHTRFMGRTLDWSKKATCAHMLRYHASKMGHELPLVPSFRSALGAKKALKTAGFESMIDMIDNYFERIPPAFMLPGDVMIVPGTEGFDAVYIKCERSKFLGWCVDNPACANIEIEPDDIRNAIGSWRL